MEDRKSEQWFSNKDLLEMIQDLREELIETRSELRTTTEAVRRYNGLREKIEATERRLAEHLLTGEGQAKAARGIREWGGWVIALISLLIVLADKL